MKETKLGKVHFINKGDYNINQEYEILDIIKYNGKVFIAKKNIPQGNIPIGDITDEYWQLIANNGNYIPSINENGILL